MPAAIEGLKVANSLTGQIITVSSGLLAFTVTFAEKFSPKDHGISAPTTLKLSWICFALSIILGFWTLMAITGTLNALDRGGPERNANRRNIQIPALAMFGFFFLAIIFLIATGWTFAGP